MSKILIILVAISAFTFEANAQFNPLKALKDVVEDSTALSEQQSQRSDPLSGNNVPNQKNDVNCAGDWNLRYYSNNEGGFQSPTRFCVPSKSYVTNENLIYDVKGFKIPHQEFVNWDECQVSASNTGSIEFQGNVIGAETILYCKIAPDTVAEIELLANDEMYYMSQMEIMLCGPNTNQPNSEWDTRIKSKYEGIVGTPGRTRGSEALRYKYSATRNEEKGDKLETLTIESYNTRYNPSTLSRYLQCDGNRMHWSFKIEMNDKVRDAFVRLMVAETVDNQAVGDDF